MAVETPEQTLERLRRLAEESREDVTPPAAPPTAAESPEETLTRLRLISGHDLPPTPRAEVTRFAGVELPESVRRYIPHAVAEVPGGFTEAVGNLAGLLAAPIAGPLTRPAQGTPERQALEELGTAGIQDDITRSQSLVQGWLRRLGLVPENMSDIRSIEARVGRDMAGAVTLAAAMVWGSPAAARLAGSQYMTSQGLSTGGRFIPASSSTTLETIGRLGTEIATHPATTARAIIGSQPGMTIARETLGPSIERAFPGTEYPLLGGLTRESLLFATEMAGGIPSYGIARRLIPVPRVERFSPMTAHSEPILRDVSDPDVAGQIARVRQVQVVDTVDRLVARALQNAADPTITETSAGINLRGGLLSARQFMENEAARAYREVDHSLRGFAGSIRDEVIDQLSIARNRPAVADNYPVERLTLIERQLMSGRDNAGRPIWREDIPVEELAEIRTRLIHQAREAAEVSVTGTQGTRALRDNIERLVNQITMSIESIGAVDPRFQPALDYANAVYRRFNDVFRRGPVGELLMTTRHAESAPGAERLPGAFRIPPSQVARQLVNPNESAEAIIMAAREIGRIRNPTGAGSMLEQSIIRSGDEAIRRLFVDDIMDFFQAQMTGAQKPSSVQDISTTFNLQRGPVEGARYRAQRWLQQNAPLLESWVSTSRDLFQVSERLNRLMLARDNYTQNILNQFLGRNASDVFEQALRMPNAREQFAGMYRTFRGNRDFLEGAQRALVDMIFAGRGADPTVALSRMRSGRYREALEEIFKNDPGKLDRLYQMTQGASEVLAGAVSSTAAGKARLVPKGVQMSVGERLAKMTSNWAAHIFGLGLGGALARLIPGMGSAGSLSIPMRVSREMRDLVASAWLGNRHKALSIIRDAIHNPGLEAWLRNYAPGNPGEARVNLEHLLRYARRFESLTNDDIDRYLTGNSRRLYWEERRRVRDELIRAKTSPFQGSR